MNAVYIYYGDNRYRTPEQRELIERLREILVLKRLKGFDPMEVVVRPPPFQNAMFTWEPSIPCELVVVLPVCPLPVIAHFINRCTNEYVRSEQHTVPVIQYTFGNTRLQGISFSNPEVVYERACEELTLASVTRVAVTIAEDILLRVPTPLVA